MKKKHNGIVLFCSIILLMSSCNEDKGNYDYEAISEAIIEGGELHHHQDLETISVVPQQNVHIEPNITFTEGKGKGDFRYEWVLYEPTTDVSAVALETISEGDTPILDMILPPSMGRIGNHFVLFRAINNQTGVEYTKKYILVVQNVMQKGYMTLCEKTNGFDIDLVANFNDTLTLYKNILETTGSELPRAGAKPITLELFVDNTAPSPYDSDASRIKYSVYVLSDKSTDRLRAEDYSYKTDYNISKASLIPKEFTPNGLVAEKMFNSGSSRSYMFMNNNWFFAQGSVAIQFYITPINRLINAPDYYKSAPYIAASPSSAILFDEDNRRFMWNAALANDIGFAAKYPGVMSTSPIADKDGDPFKFNEPNYSLKHMANRTFEGSAFSLVQGYAIVENTKDNKYEMLTFEFNHLKTAKLNKYILPPSINIADIKYFTIHPKEPYLYCATETSVYSVLMPEMIVRDITASVLPTGHKISMFQIIRGVSNDFALGTYDPSKKIDECGTLQVFQTEPNTGRLIITNHPKEKTPEGQDIPKRWDGLGKIISLYEKTR